MHSYLKSIGFGKLKNETEIEQILTGVYHDYSQRELTRSEDNRIFVQMQKEYAPHMGVTLCGIMDRSGFHRQYYFPYFEGSQITTTEEVTVERRVNGDSYEGVCDDSRVGVSIIFYLQNVAEYEREQKPNSSSEGKMTTSFSALSTAGMILLPIKKKRGQVEVQRESTIEHRQLMNAAKNGDEDAIESLTIEDMGLYSMISRRMYAEDIYSIVDTFFMPYGIECDQYQIMGNIQRCSKVENFFTKEEVYIMNIECNDLRFDVCINASDLLGEPEAGRRFKGNVWLQGKINFE